MSNLSQYHPFRDSVNKTSEGSLSPTSEGVADKDKKDDLEYKSWFSFKTKMRLALGCIGFIGLWYTIGSFFDESPELKGGFYSSLDRSDSKKSNSKIVEEPANSIFDERDLDERGRSVAEANSKAGFISSLFCRGGRKASFCD